MIIPSVAAHDVPSVALSCLVDRAGRIDTVDVLRFHKILERLGVAGADRAMPSKDTVYILIIRGIFIVISRIDNILIGLLDSGVFISTCLNARQIILNCLFYLFFPLNLILRRTAPLRCDHSVRLSQCGLISGQIDSPGQPEKLRMIHHHRIPNRLNLIRIRTGCLKRISSG